MAVDMKKKTIYRRGQDYAQRIDSELFPYSIRELRIIAMAYETGWKAAKRNKKP